jgi:hypothetical protein
MAKVGVARGNDRPREAQGVLEGVSHFLLSPCAAVNGCSATVLHRCCIVASEQLRRPTKRQPRLPPSRNSISARSSVSGLPCVRGRVSAMPRNYVVFGDIEGKLDVLRVECTKCSRRSVYYLHRLIEKHGRKGNMMKWREQLNGDCPRRDAHSLQESCDLICPDLPKVL